MKYSLALTLASAGSLAAAHGHGGHAQFHKRVVDTETNTIEVAGPTVYDFVVLESGVAQPISDEAACEGLADHELEFLGPSIAAACAALSTSASVTSTSISTTSTSTTSVPTTTPAPATSTIAPLVLLQTSAAISSISSSSTVESSSTAEAAASTAAATSSGTGVDRTFVSGELSCDTFPSDYGALSLDYLGIGGWSGIQYLTIVDEIISSISTAVAGGDNCTEGAMCSYACPPGYLKTQWPSLQGSSGESIGGLTCKNNKLHLTNSDYSDKLCIAGTGGVNVVNKLSTHVAVCRTDYPGTESETIPLSATAGDTHALACPNSAEYYKWENKDTSAQYYVNNKGVSTEVGCQWGDGSAPVGNWAPMNIGVGYTDGTTWLSMFKNEPTTDADLDFKVKIVGTGIKGECFYDGKGTFYDASGAISGTNGCTVSFTTGEAYFHFYE
ncbi:Secreted beta-glucosidase sun1 [Penicillium taxi]|uniref:Secreted beta-glucosidase sun1 n=1 Tax=Penicillium taxi TaxID=168475 RepID=UPI002545452E|nr:Secreted beta-glucosidase sun1 [Penicillium taxi]KAJ5908094.1 Secreted beta-glucosidase sun1 [Penicillium taxi]